MIMHKGKIKKNELLILLFLILMIRPYYIQLFESINRIWAYMTFVCAIYSLILVILKKKTRYIIAEAVFFGIYLLATLFSHPENLMSAASVVGQAVLGYHIGILALSKSYRGCVERMVPKVFSIYLYLDVLSVVLGISTRVFHAESNMTLLGYDNYAAFCVLPMLSVKMGFSLKNKGKLSREDWFCWAACTAAKIITLSYAASIIMIMFAIIFLMVSKWGKLKRFLNVRNAIILIVVLFVGIYSFNIQRYLAALLIASGKGIELNSRTTIWRFVVKSIFKVPIIGLGYHTAQDFLNFFKFPAGWTSTTHAHNILLDLIVQTGILGLITYINILRELKVGKVLLKNRWYQIFMIGILCYLILGFFDFYFYLSPFWLLIALTKSEAILEQQSFAMKMTETKELA